MLFNSYSFLLIFLPASLTGYWLAARFLGPRQAIFVGTIFSFIFYGYWSVEFALLLLVSIIGNFVIAQHIRRVRGKKWPLILGISGNILVISYFKYSNFFIENLEKMTGMDLVSLKVILPIGISFYTFQQIAYLMDSHRNEVTTDRFSSYVFFVSFFPQLIAGPIVHHREIIERIGSIRQNHMSRYLAIGLSIFVIGLFKKVIIADNIAIFADQIFDNIEYGLRPDLFESWTAALAYTFQIYFDFSAYSDMAMGLAYMMGFRLPVNFASPYKATSVVDFWHRWHVTLSRFLRDYVYFPLGGNRRGKFARYRNLLITMALGGLWHGAGWTFVLWGVLHGCALALHHLYRGLLSTLGASDKYLPQPLGWLFTFVFVVVSWVIFRAESLTDTVHIYRGMLGLNGVKLPSAVEFLAPYFGSLYNSGHFSIDLYSGLPMLLMLGVLVLAFPNTHQLMGPLSPGKSSPGYPATRTQEGVHFVSWWPSPIWSATLSALLFVSLIAMNDASEFIYFQF